MTISTERLTKLLTHLEREDSDASSYHDETVTEHEQTAPWHWETDALARLIRTTARGRILTLGTGKRTAR